MDKRRAIQIMTKTPEIHMDNEDGKYGPERYIEAHIWTDDVINEYLTEQH